MTTSAERRGQGAQRLQAALAGCLLLGACSGLWPDGTPEDPRLASLEDPCVAAAGLLGRGETLTLDGRRLKAYAEACLERGSRPQLGWALLGWAEQYLGDRSASARALNAALQTDPDEGPAVWLAPIIALDARATLFAAGDDPRGALDEVDLAGSLLARFTGIRYPDLLSTILVRRATYLALAGEEAEARVTFERALMIASSREQGYEVLRREGWVALSQGRFAAAYRRLTQAFTLAPAAPQRLQTALRIYAAEAQGLGEGPARQGLARRIATAELDLDLYPGLILRYLLGEIDAESLTERADQESRLNPSATMAQLDYYKGLSALLGGEPARAERAFRRVLDSEVVALPEYFFARGALERLKEAASRP